MSNDGVDPIHLTVKVQTVNNELFDFNVIDSLSYGSYKLSHNPNDLIFLHKIQDQKNLDTIIIQFNSRLK